MRPIDREFSEGYVDGRESDSPEAGSNRSAAYRHSFEVGRAERENKPIPAAISRERVRSILIDEGICPDCYHLGDNEFCSIHEAAE